MKFNFADPCSLLPATYYLILTTLYLLPDTYYLLLLFFAGLLHLLAQGRL
jgi:hypothetical protein